MKPKENEFDYGANSCDFGSNVKGWQATSKKFYTSLKPGGKLILHVPASILKKSKAATIRKRYLKNGIIGIANQIGFEYPYEYRYPLP